MLRNTLKPKFPQLPQNSKFCLLKRPVRSTNCQYSMQVAQLKLKTRPATKDASTNRIAKLFNAHRDQYIGQRDLKYAQRDIQYIDKHNQTQRCSRCNATNMQLEPKNSQDPGHLLLSPIYLCFCFFRLQADPHLGLSNVLDAYACQNPEFRRMTGGASNKAAGPTRRLPRQ